MVENNNFLDLHYFTDKNGFIFITEGYYYPEGFVRARLTLFPNSRGDREIDGKRYSKFYESGIELKELVPSSYVNEYSPDKSGCFVPLKNVRKIWDPRVSFKKNPYAPELFYILSKLGLKTEGNLGHIGSFLLNTQKKYSDLDIVIYGRSNSISFAENLPNLAEDLCLRRLDGRAIKKRFVRYRKLCPPEIEDLLLWNSVCRRSRLEFFLSDGRLVGPHCVYFPEEIPPDPTPNIRNEIKEVELVGKVISEDGSYFMPRNFLVKAPDGRTYQVITYFWRFWIGACVKEDVLVRGKLIGETITLENNSHGIFPLKSYESHN